MSSARALVLSPAALDTIEQFRQAFGREVRLWTRERDCWVALWPAARNGDCPTQPPGASVPLTLENGATLRVEVVGADSANDEAAACFLASALDSAWRHDEEVRAFSREMADRYEEITLLYSISEILGSVISLEEAADTILEEVVDTLAMHRATLWVHEPAAAHLVRVATVGAEGHPGPVVVSDPCSITATVFRERRHILLTPGEEYRREGCEAEGTPRGAFLSVPVSYTPPQGEARTVGVLNVSGKASGHGSDEPFSAGDLKLVSAIASQIGAAVENSRLVAASLRQERIAREMELAHDLQLKLLPALEPFSAHADVAARCMPAESVGGDFYHLFRLPQGRLGVVIGDVSSHGFGAALIMALAMSAISIYASEGDPPARVLQRVHDALIDELTSTEMYLTLFYGVLDPAAGGICYASAGHSHAFRVRGNGSAERLAATSPPLGIVDLEHYGEERTSWCAGEDLLFLFTDGLSDALGIGETAGEEALLNAVVEARSAGTDELIERVFSLGSEPDQFPAPPPDDRTAVIVRV